MRHRANRLVFTGFIVSAALLVGSAWAEGPTANEIVARMVAKNAERQAALDHYAAERTYTLEYKGTGGAHSAEMLVDVEYSGGQKHFTVVSEKGSKLICEKVLHKLVESEQEAGQRTNKTQMTLSPENYNLELVGREKVGGIDAWVLKVAPKVESKFTYRGRVWVSVDDYAMVRVLGEPAKNPSWWISRASFDWRYERNGEFWLPERNVAVSHVRIGGDATLTIDYGTYRIESARAARRDASADGAKVVLAALPGKVVGN